MKKIKYIAPILGVVASAGAIAPILTSCSNSNVNKVSLQANQSAERTVTGNSGILAFYFKQENTKNPEDTKVYIKDFAINGLSGLSAPAHTVKYVADSVGNMRVTIDVASIAASWSNVKTIEITLTFKNKTAGTKHEFGPIKINVVESGSESGSEEAVAEDGIPIVLDDDTAEFIKCNVVKAGFDNKMILCEIKPMYADDGYMPKDIHLYDNEADKELVEGIDYIYFTNVEDTCGYVWVPNLGHEQITVKVDELVGQPVYLRYGLPFAHQGGTVEDNVISVKYKTEDEAFIPKINPPIKTLTSVNMSAKTYVYDNDGNLMDELSFSLNSSNDTPGEEFNAYLDKFNAVLLGWNRAMEVDKRKSVVLVKYDIKGKDEDGNECEFYGSCGLKVDTTAEQGDDSDKDEEKGGWEK